MKWLFKTEPTDYSFHRLRKDGKTLWTGVKNALALKHLRQVRKDDVLTSEARVKYLANRFAAISAYYRYTKRDSDIEVFTFDKHLVGLNVTAQF